MTRVDCIPLGIAVNKHAARFYDEGEDFWPKRYAIWGRLVAQQPEQLAFTIIDAKPMGTFLPPVFPPIEASSLEHCRRSRSPRRAGADSVVIQRFSTARHLQSRRAG